MRSIRKDKYPQNLIFTLVARGNKSPREQLPAKICTFKVTAWILVEVLYHYFKLWLKSFASVDLCTSLAKAIATGDILESQKLVRALIEKKMKAKATVLCEEKMCKFNIKIHVESVNMEPTEPISLLVTDPLTTCIRNLKEEVRICCLEFDWPPSFYRG